MGTYRVGILNDGALLWDTNANRFYHINDLIPEADRIPETSWPPPQSGWELMSAWAINDLGQIAAEGTHVIAGDWTQRACRLNRRRV